MSFGTRRLFNVWLACALCAAPASAQQVDLDIAAGGTDQIWTATSANAAAGYWFDLGPVGRGDDRRDLIIGAPGWGTDPGRVYIVFGGPVRRGNNLLSSADVIFNGGPGTDRFGFSTAAGNILASSGPRDLVIGAPNADSNKGRVYLYRGSFTAGQVFGTADARMTIIGRAGDRIGTAVGTADLNGDGFRELIIGAGGNDRVYVINGSAALSGTIDLSVVAPVITLTGDSVGDMVSAGDVTGDGLYDLVLGAPLAASTAGRVYVVRGRAGGFPAAINLDAAADALITGVNVGDNAGSAIDLADVDADGVRDILIGAPGSDGPGNSRGNSGAVYVLWGRAGLASMNLAAANVTIYGGASGDLAGTQTDAGDVNRDTPDDTLILSAGANGGKGRIFVLYGRSRTAFGSVIDLANGYDRSLFNSAAEGPIGNTVVFEVTGEGARDIIVSHPWATASAGANAGKVYFSLSPKLEPTPKTPTLTTASGGSVSTTIQVRNPGSGVLPWTVTSQASWLTVSPASGSSTSASTGTFTVTATASGSSAGPQVGTVRVKSETKHLDMFVNVTVTLNINTQVSRIPDVDGDGTPDATPATPRYILGLGRLPGAGGWVESHAGADRNYGLAAWVRTPWGAYNSGSNGETYPAVGDVDGDGLDEVVLGLGPASAGTFVVLDDDAHNYAVLKWITVDWGGYNSTNGVVYPAVGDIDGDGKAEIVVGLGRGGGGWFRIYDDASTNFAPLRWGRVQWDYYNGLNGETHPAVGDLNGDGKSEIIFGFGQSGAGWVEVFGSSATDYAHQSWIRTSDATYNGGSNGAVWPAAGDIDNDGRAELVLGLGRGGRGRAEVREDANGGHAPVRWVALNWAAYDNATGEVHPAVGNLDADGADEIILGLGPYANGGWYLLLDDGTTGNASIGWKQVQWGTYISSGGPTWPAIGKLR